MSLDVRDELFWIKQAKKRVFLRQVELFSATLLPNQKVESIRKTLDELKWQIYEIDHEGETDEIEAQSAKRLKELEEKLRDKRKKRRG